MNNLEYYHIIIKQVQMGSLKSSEKNTLISFLKQKLNRTSKTGQNTPVLMNLSNLKWVTFVEIMKTDNFYLLDKKYSKEKVYTDDDLVFFTKEFQKLQDEVYKLEDSQEAKQFLEKNIDKLILIQEIKLLKDDLDLLHWYNNQKDFYFEYGYGIEWNTQIQGLYAMIVKHNKYVKIQYFEEVEDNMVIIDRIIRSLIDRYNAKHEQVVKTTEAKEVSIVYEVLQVCRITTLQLNARTMTCEVWIEAKKIALSMIKEQQKHTKDGV
jgi:hypothetical protein